MVSAGTVTRDRFWKKTSKKTFDIQIQNIIEPNHAGKRYVPVDRDSNFDNLKRSRISHNLDYSFYLSVHPENRVS